MIVTLSLLLYLSLSNPLSLTFLANIFSTLLNLKEIGFFDLEVIKDNTFDENEIKIKI
jgi:hypothetical protein